MKIDELLAYRKHITDTYDERSGKHDRSEWHRKTALKLLEGSPPCLGDSVLDIGTGTGTIAFHSAARVGPKGRVIGIDLSQGMLAQANEKLTETELHNLEFAIADAERLEFSNGAFDCIYCANAFFCMLEPLATLRRWRRLLKPGGRLGFHALPETSFFWVSIARNVLARYGFPYNLNTPTGSLEKTETLLTDAGFSDIDIRLESMGHFVPIENAMKTWIQQDDFAPGQYPHPVRGIAPEILTQCQRDYEARIEELNTDKGVWNDVSMYYIYARK